VLEEVRKVRTHPTADEVYEMVRLRLLKVSLGTVYRNLDRLSREGLINTIEGPGQRRYDGELDDHVHLRCTCCGYIGDVESASIPMELLNSVVGDFEISTCQVEFLGICGECRKGRSQEPSTFAEASAVAEAMADKSADRGARSQSSQKEQGVEQ
jgi:Fur family ferric uptake transcriptional regulator